MQIRLPQPDGTLKASQDVGTNPAAEGTGKKKAM